MKDSELVHGKAYECVIDGYKGIEKTSIVPLAMNAAKDRRFIIFEARLLYQRNPDFFHRLIAMSFDEIVDEDIDGGPDRQWSSNVLEFAIDEQGNLYDEECDAYLNDFVEVDFTNDQHMKAKITALGSIRIEFAPRGHLQLFQLEEPATFTCSLRKTEVTSAKVALDLKTGEILSNGAYGQLLAGQ